MTLTFSEFLRILSDSPAFVVTALLAAGVILVNGGTDAPNAIAACVAARAIAPRRAVLLAAVCNFLGVLAVTAVSPAVAETVSGMADFGADSRGALIGLCAGMFAVVLWAAAAWYFGIPTSESHALIAGLSGAAIAVQRGLGGICWGEWVKVLYGLGLPAGLGFAAGWAAARFLRLACRRMDRRRGQARFRRAQIFGGAAMAFAHGAQDGQKFMGVFLLGAAMARGQPMEGAFRVPVWLMAGISLLMAAGTSVGGYKIIRTVGMRMVRLDAHEGFAADTAAAGALLAASLAGIPVSTTHMKTTALMGVSASRRLRAVNWRVAGEMAWAWALTFPGCGAVGYLTARLFLWWL